MALSKISGTVSNLQFSSEMTGHMNKGSGSVQTKQVVTFRLGDKSVTVKLPVRPDIAEGETVSVAGTEKNGLFTGVAIRNEKTGVVFVPSAVGAFVMGGLMLCLGVMTLLIILGIFLLPFAAWVLYQGYQYQQAEKMLRAG